MKPTILKIRTIGDDCLRQESTPIEEAGMPERILAVSMLATMKSAQGVGLAAPQVGINKQLIIVDVGDGPVVMINPQIVDTEGEAVMEEGCLSVPDQTVKIVRPYRVVVKYKTLENTEKEEEYDELFARAVQHEIDHLHGTLIVDYALNKKKK